MLPDGRGAGSFYGVRESRSQARGRRGCAGGMRRALCLLLAPQKAQLGFFLGEGTFLPIICPNCACMQLFLVPYSFFVFCSSRDVCSGASAAATAAGSQVPACLRACHQTLESRIPLKHSPAQGLNWLGGGFFTYARGAPHPHPILNEIGKQVQGLFLQHLCK